MEMNTIHFMGFVLIIKGILMGLGAGSPVIMQGAVNPLIWNAPLQAVKLFITQM